MNINPLSIHDAATEGDLNRIIQLLNQGTNVNEQDEDGATALHNASYKGHVAIVRYLLNEADADVSIQDNEGCTPLHDAVLGNKFEVVKILVDEGKASVNTKNKEGRSPIELAVEPKMQQFLKMSANEELIRILYDLSDTGRAVLTHIEKCSKINNTNKKEWTALHQAAFDDDCETASTLLQQDVPLGLKTSDNKTAYALAKSDEMKELLRQPTIDSFLSQAYQYEENEEWQDALDCYDEALLCDPESMRVLIQKAENYQKQEKYTEALRVLDDALIIGQKDNPMEEGYEWQAVAWDTKAKIHWRLKEYAFAIESFNQSSKYDPAHSDGSYYSIFHILLEQEKLGEAFSYCEELAQSLFLNSFFISKKIEFLFFFQQYQKASDYFDELFKQNSDSDELRCLHGYLLLQKNLYMQANLVFQKVLRKTPEYPLALQGKKLIELSQKLQQINLASFEALDKQAILMTEERFQRKFDSHELYPLFYFRGLILEAWGKQDEAIAAYKKALERQYRNCLAKFSLMRLEKSNDNNNNAVTDSSIRVLPPSREIQFSDLKFERKIGSGGFGDVFQGKWSNTKVAIKKLSNEQFSTKNEKDEFKSEIKVMAELNHLHIVQFYGASFEPLCIVMEYMVGGSLHDFLQNPSNKVDHATEVRLVEEITAGLNYLHVQQKIIHRDLKCSNILLTAQGQVKLADFGLSMIHRENRSHREVAGSIRWMAPELFKNADNTFMSDVWSLGMVIYEILARVVPFHDEKNTKQISYLIVNQSPPIKVPDTFPKGLAQLMNRCWMHEPKERPNTKEVISFLDEMRQAKTTASNRYPSNSNSISAVEQNIYPGNSLSMNNTEE